jgi:predicted Fe-Mo cluster-binding NifX family protein
MKIAIARDDEKTISEHFGRAEGFRIFEIKDGKIVKEEYRKNVGKSDGKCGSCNHAAMITNIKDCQTVISYGMGRRIYQDLTDNKINAAFTEEKTVREALDKFVKSSLKNRTDKLH